MYLYWIQVNFIRPWKDAPVTRGRGPYRARGHATPVTRERGPYRAWGHAAPVTRERGPYRLGVMLRRSRGSVDPTGLGSCCAGHAGAWTLPAWGRATPVTRERG